jgi:hypothetical protein
MPREEIQAMGDAARQAARTDFAREHLLDRVCDIVEGEKAVAAEKDIA